MLSKIQTEAESRMQKAIETLTQDFAKIRTGRAHPDLLDNIMVMYYNTSTPIRQLASVVIEDSRTLAVTPYDKSVVGAVDKAIRAAGLGLNPVTAGQVIRIHLPPLTEERRITLTKQTKAEAEKTRVVIRNIRRDSNQHIEKLLKEKTISEDEKRKTQDIIQKLTDKYISKVEQLLSEKETSLMSM